MVVALRHITSLPPFLNSSSSSWTNERLLHHPLHPDQSLGRRVSCSGGQAHNAHHSCSINLVHAGLPLLLVTVCAVVDLLELLLSPFLEVVLLEQKARRALDMAGEHLVLVAELSGESIVHGARRSVPNSWRPAGCLVSTSPRPSAEDPAG